MTRLISLHSFLCAVLSVTRSFAAGTMFSKGPWRNGFHFGEHQENRQHEGININMPD